MTQIRKMHRMSDGVQVYPQTHTKAVIDDNGYTAESRLQAMQDEINQAQLEVGAVPSDLTPTENSTNWVTSGGVYNQLNVGDANIDIDLTQYTAVRAFPNPSKWLVTNDSYPYYGIFIPIEPYQKYRIKANENNLSYYAFLKTNTYSNNTTVDYATGCTRISVPSDTETIDTAPNDAHYLWVATYTSTDITPQKVEIYNKKSIAEILENSDTTPQKNSENLITSGGVYNSISSIDEDLYGTKIYNNYEAGKYIDQSTNNIKSNSNWALTEYIPVTPYDTVRVIFQTTGSAGISCATFFDANKQAINSWTTNKYTNERTIPAEVSEGETGSRAYVRCGLYLPNIETCEVYINDNIVWNYSGRLEGGLISRLSSYYGTDPTPVKDSTNVVTSGGTYNAIYDVKTHAESLQTSSYNEIPLDDYLHKVIGWYISVTYNYWDTSSTTKSFFLPIKPNTRYRIVSGENGMRYAVLKTNTAPVLKSTPDYATGETKIHTVGANQVVEFISPEDAHWLNINSSLKDVGSMMPEKLEEYTNLGGIVEKVETMDLTPIYISIFAFQYIIDARVSSSTFGKVITATNDSWGCTPYIDLLGAKYVKYYANTVSTSNNYAGVTGTVYYDENYEPLEEGVRLIEYGSAYKAEWITEEIPSGARYMRIGLGTGNTGFKIYRFKLLAEDIYGLQEKIDEIDEKANKEEFDILRNSRYSADGATSGTVGFLHFSDIHGDEGAAKAIRAYYDKYSSYINDMLSTGDVVYYYAADGIDFYTQNGLTDALMALGNHDGCTVDGPNKQGSADWDAMGAQWDYETYYAPYISGWGVTQPTDAAANYLMYYYKDYTTPKVRLIVLDVMHQTAEQLQWFTDTLADAVTNEYTVVVASHYIPNTFVETNVVKKSDGDKTSFHWLGSNEVTSIDSRFKLATTYADAVETFIENGGKFAVWLCGHYHLDFFTYSNTHPNILFCAINQAGYRRGGGLGYRVIGDHCANMVTIHPALGLIKIHRIGLTTDKYLRPINVLVYDYVNKKVISNY